MNIIECYLKLKLSYEVYVSALLPMSQRKTLLGKLYINKSSVANYMLTVVEVVDRGSDTKLQVSEKLS